MGGGVLISKFAVGANEVGVGADAKEGGGEVSDGLHDIPAQFPEGEPQEDQPLHQKCPQSQPDDKLGPPACAITPHVEIL